MLMYNHLSYSSDTAAHSYEPKPVQASSAIQVAKTC
jgi:hypothetical protein